MLSFFFFLQRGDTPRQRIKKLKQRQPQSRKPKDVASISQSGPYASDMQPYCLFRHIRASHIRLQGKYQGVRRLSEGKTDKEPNPWFWSDISNRIQPNFRLFSPDNTSLPLRGWLFMWDLVMHTPAATCHPANGVKIITVMSHRGLAEYIAC